MYDYYIRYLSQRGCTEDDFPQYSSYLKRLESCGIDETMFGKLIGPLQCEEIFNSVKSEFVLNILEIGRSKGHSFGFFKHSFPNAKVVSIDIVHDKDCDVVASCFDKNYEFLIGTSKLLEQREDKYDIILIDGDHSYEGALADWENVQGSFGDNCIVCFDDIARTKTHRKNFGCGKAFNEIQDYRKQVFKDKRGIPHLGIVYIEQEMGKE